MRLFSENDTVNDSKLWKASKPPFLFAWVALLAVAAILIWRAQHPIDETQIIVASACVALGSILGCLPFIFDYRVSVKSIDAAALGSITEKIQSLEKLSSQISAATNEWMNAQMQAEKTSNLAKEIADGMAGEVQRFSAFMQKMNESEKAALRLEADKLRRGEAEWMQILVRILDHVFLLHTAAVRSGQPKVIDQISNFQNACHDAIRRVGLAPFSAEPGEAFDPPKHQDVDGKAQAVDGGVVAETIASGFTFQGKLLRPALVRVKAPDAELEPLPEPAEEKTEDLPLQEPN